MKNKIELQDIHTSATIIDGELVSFKKNNVEYIHQKGNKGWSKSDDEMFPIIGPTSINNFRVQTKRGDAIQDQHGQLRELDYTLLSSDKKSASFLKKYSKNTLITNTKFPEKSTEKSLFWPYSFSFQKSFSLENNVLKIEFIIDSEKKMPFMLGYHPAFLLSGSNTEYIEAKGKKITLEDVLAAGAAAYPVLNTATISLFHPNQQKVEITTTGFDNFMLWTEVNNMVCIEPITQYISLKDTKKNEENRRVSNGKETFSVEITVV